MRRYLEEIINCPSTGPDLRLLGESILSMDEAVSCDSINQLLAVIWTPKAERAVNHLQARPPANDAAPRRNRIHRAYRYKRYQELFTKDKASLANHIVKGIEPGTVTIGPSAETIAGHYLDIFAGASPPDEDPITDPKDRIPGLYAPLREEEIRKAIWDRRSSNSAGPDGMTAADLRGSSLRAVAIFFNAMLLTGHIPPILKACRTTLIPKGEADPADISSWRPITVANILLRTMHRMMSNRLGALPLHQSQRGFVSEDGTMANAIVLQSAIKTCRRSLKPYSIVSLDLRKAFDSVPHESVARAMRRFNVDRRIARFIMSGLTGCHTVISANRERTGAIPILRGVKQGDPLSPLLFNLVLDELMCKLSSLPTGIDLDGTLIPALAYADDLLLLAHSDRDMKAIINTSVDFFEARSLQLNAGKCSSISVKLLPARRKLYLAPDSIFMVRGTPIPRTGAESSFKYLGHKYGFMGTDVPNIDALKVALNNLQRAPLKPFQKLLLLQEYMLPKFLYSLQNPKIYLATLEQADKSIRKTVKGFLHLPPQVANALLYARRDLGGLGIMCLRARIPDIILGRIRKLDNSGDQQIQAALRTPYVTGVRSRLEASLRLFGVSGQQKTFWRHKLDNAVSGAGLPGHCGNPGTHRWIRDPPNHWSGEDYVRALQLRMNVLPTIGGLHNARLQPGAKMCRGGCQRIETLSHVLQRCPVTHHQRIARHNHAVNVIARACTTKGLPVEIEPTIRDGTGRLHKPDLMVTKDDGIHIVEVGVNWETPRPLAQHFLNKVATYSTPEFILALEQLYPGIPINIGAIILGARGTWCEDNNQVVNRLGLPKSLASTLSSGVLQGGIFTHRYFGTATWDNPHRRRPQEE